VKCGCVALADFWEGARLSEVRKACAPPWLLVINSNIFSKLSRSLIQSLVRLRRQLGAPGTASSSRLPGAASSISSKCSGMSASNSCTVAMM